MTVYNYSHYSPVEEKPEPWEEEGETQVDPGLAAPSLYLLQTNVSSIPGPNIAVLSYLKVFLQIYIH